MECLSLSKFGNPAFNQHSICIPRRGKLGSTSIVVLVDHMINTRSLYQSPNPNQRENKREITWGLSCISSETRIPLLMGHLICNWVAYPHIMVQRWRLLHLHSFKQLLHRHQTRTIRIRKQETKKVVSSNISRESNRTCSIMKKCSTNGLRYRSWNIHIAWHTKGWNLRIFQEIL